MKGGHGDNYYYQMVNYIRRFKGMRKPPAASGPKTVRIDCACRHASYIGRRRHRVAHHWTRG
jgi:hypothetical protein